MDYIERLIQCLKSTKIYHHIGIPFNSYDEAIQKLTELFLEERAKEKRVFFVGNGGSAAIAGHMTADFLKNGRMKTYSLYEHSLVTCMGNDYGYESVFSKPLDLLADQGDLLVAISSSGNSLNIVDAIQVARKKEMEIVTFSGFKNDNKIIGMGAYNVYVPVSHYGIVESIHNLMLQQIVDMILEYDDLH